MPEINQKNAKLLTPPATDKKQGPGHIREEKILKIIENQLKPSFAKPICLQTMHTVTLTIAIFSLTIATNSLTTATFSLAIATSSLTFATFSLIIATNTLAIATYSLTMATNCLAMATVVAAIGNCIA